MITPERTSRWRAKCQGIATARNGQNQQARPVPRKTPTLAQTAREGKARKTPAIRVPRSRFRSVRKEEQWGRKGKEQLPDSTVGSDWWIADAQPGMSRPHARLTAHCPHRQQRPTGHNSPDVSRVIVRGLPPIGRYVTDHGMGFERYFAGGRESRPVEVGVRVIG